MTDVNYRDYAIDPRDIKTIVLTKSIVVPIMELCAIADYVDAEQYRNWLTDWKRTYSVLSNIIAEIKYDVYDATSADRHMALNALKRLANTMLNARQYAKDRRRAVRDAEQQVA